MSFGVGNLGMLLGLLALAIPVLIHFLQRRRFDVVDWGAMQFLNVAPSTRRRWWWDELILLLIRMGLLGLLVLALASPFLEGSLVQPLAGSSRTVILVVDPSASMGRGNAWPEAQASVLHVLDELNTGDRAMLILASSPPVALTPEPTSDLAGLRTLVQRLPEPDGASDWPEAMEQALDTLTKSAPKGESYLLLIRDNQKSGWSDKETLERWERIARAWKGTRLPAKPTLIELSPAGQAPTCNIWLGALQADRTVVAPGQKVSAQGQLQWQGLTTESAKATLIVARNGVEFKRWSVPLSGTEGSQPVSLSALIPAPGSHLLTLKVEVDAGIDSLARDNVQHLVVESVQGLPVLLVDGEEAVTPTGTTHFLRNALGGTEKGTGLFEVQTFGASRLTSDLLLDGDRLRFRVAILSDLPGLRDEQGRALEKFLRLGGSVLVSLGPRSLKHRESFLHAHGDGVGWLPYRMEEAEGKEGQREGAAHILAIGPPHPMLDYFRDPARGLAEARFPRWLKGSIGEGASSISFLDVGQPFLVESRVGPGRVLVCTVPLDRSWGSDFPSVHAYPVFVHRAVLYLAEAGNEGRRLMPGQRVTWQPPLGDQVTLPTTVYWQEGEGEPRAFIVKGLPWTGPEVRRTGPAKLTWGVGRHIWFVTPFPASESDLMPVSSEDASVLEHMLGLRSVPDVSHGLASEVVETPHSVEIWWVLLLLVILFLFAEVCFTRRLARQRGMV